jgi:hypothetical protein
MHAIIVTGALETRAYITICDGRDKVVVAAVVVMVATVVMTINSSTRTRTSTPATTKYS